MAFLGGLIPGGLFRGFPGLWWDCSDRVVLGPHLLPNARRFVNRIRAGILEFKPRLFWTNRGKNWANPDLPDDPSDTQQIVLTETGSTIYCVKSGSVWFAKVALGLLASCCASTVWNDVVSEC